MLQFQKKKTEPMPRHHEVRVRTLGGSFPERSYLVEHDTRTGETIDVIGKIVRGGKPLAQFVKREWPNAFCEYPNWRNGLLFVYQEVQPKWRGALIAEMNRHKPKFCFPLLG